MATPCDHSLGGFEPGQV